jgi:AcrR family transcriptional regulator
MSPETKDKVDTKDRLLEAAELLFAEKGPDATSVRDIAAAADANLGAMNYHFGTKDELLRAVVARRLRPLNEERLRLLDEAEREGGERGPALEAVLNAFIAPTIHLTREKPAFARLMGRLHLQPDPELRRYFLSIHERLIEKLTSALRRALPAAPIEEVFWRMHFLVGAMIHTWTGCMELEEVTKGVCRFDDEEALIRRLVAFGAAGLRGAVAAKPEARA